jgi:glutaminase
MKTTLDRTRHAWLLVLAFALLVAPTAWAQTPTEIQAALDAAYTDYKDLQEGANADYIPALAKVDPNIYGIALVTTDGKVYTAGDVESEVAIESISKVFTMAKVFEQSGPEIVTSTIGTDAW